MATAPKPGKKKSAHRSGFRVQIYDDVYELEDRDVGPSDIGLVRQTTGRSLNSYLSDMDIDSVGVIVWLARRKSGEKKLTLDKVFKVMPTRSEFNELIDEGRADFGRIEDYEDDEEEGEGDDVINVESSEGRHPLPPAAT